MKKATLSPKKLRAKILEYGELIRQKKELENQLFALKNEFLAHHELSTIPEARTYGNAYIGNITILPPMSYQHLDRDKIKFFFAKFFFPFEEWHYPLTEGEDATITRHLVSLGYTTTTVSEESVRYFSPSKKRPLKRSTAPQTGWATKGATKGAK